MNYNEEYRTPRDRVSSCGCGNSQSANRSSCARNSENTRITESPRTTERTVRNACGCEQNRRQTRDTSRTCERNAERNTRQSMCGCEKNSERSARDTDCNNTRMTRDTSRTCERNAERSARQSMCACERNSEHSAHESGYSRNTRSTENSGCGCARETRNTTGRCPNTICTTVPVTEGCVDTYPIAMAYVPMQQWRELYDPTSGHSRGTIFRELDLEWYPTNCRKDCRTRNT